MAGSFEGRFAAISGQLAVREILAGPRREVPDAIICGNDQTAIGAMRELQAAGIRVPADVAVVGFDDMHLSALLAPPLTTVRQPMRLLGERACSRLLQRIADPALPPLVERLPAELIIREAAAAAGSPRRLPWPFRIRRPRRDRYRTQLRAASPRRPASPQRRVQARRRGAEPNQQVPGQPVGAVGERGSIGVTARDATVDGMLTGRPNPRSRAPSPRPPPRRRGPPSRRGRAGPGRWP